MRKAVAAHLRHESAWYCDLTGPFVCPHGGLADLGTALTSASAAWIDLALVVTGGAASVADATDAVATDARLRLRAIEVPAGQDGDPVQATAEVIAALDAVPLAAATGYVEVPLAQFADPAQAGRLLALIDQHGYRPKLRTGGTVATAFPDEPALAACLVELASRRIAFKCTAGLHHAVRHTAPGTGFEHHGFLNVLLAVGEAAAGADVPIVAAVLAERDPDRVAAAIAALSQDAAEDIRWLFGSFGTCSTDDPVTDLIGLGLLTQQ